MLHNFAVGVRRQVPLFRFHGCLGQIEVAVGLGGQVLHRRKCALCCAECIVSEVRIIRLFQLGTPIDLVTLSFYILMHLHTMFGRRS